jgi:hypothetical protein
MSVYVTTACQSTNDRALKPQPPECRTAVMTGHQVSCRELPHMAHATLPNDHGDTTDQADPRQWLPSVMRSLAAHHFLCFPRHSERQVISQVTRETHSAFHG